MNDDALTNSPRAQPALGQPVVMPDAPTDLDVTAYDQQHFSTYARLVFADDAGEDWRQSAREILGLDVDKDEDAARRCWKSHSDRARWIATEGYEMLLIQAGIIPAN